MRVSPGRSFRRHYPKLIIVLVVIIIAVLALIGLYDWGREKVDNISYPVGYKEDVEKFTKQYDVPKPLVFAVIRCESGFRPEAVSSIGARGLMQLTEDTFDFVHARIGTDETYDDMFDPVTNIRYGTYLLSILINEFGTIDNALCAYHAGWGSAKKWLKNTEYAPDGENIVNIPFADTRQYVQKVLDTMERYSELYDM